MININTLVLSGGGIKGLAELGAIYYLQDTLKFDINKILIYSGTSIGSVISLLMVCGYTPEVLFTELRGINSFLNINKMSIMNLISNFGLFKIEELSNMVAEKIIRKFKYIPTLKQLFDITGKDLYICTVNSYNSEVVYLNYRTHPDKSCLEAVEDSCRIPLIFERNKFLDGGFGDNFPLLALTKYYNLQDLNILGILLTGKEIVNPSNNNGTGILNYIYNLLNISINSNTTLRMEHIQNLYKSINKKIDIVVVQFERKTLIPLYISEEEKLKMFELGYKTMKDYCETNEVSNVVSNVVNNTPIITEEIVMKPKIDCDGNWDDF